MTVAKSQLGFILLVTCLLFPPGCHSSDGHFNKHVALFIFGDSLFDAGNNNYLNTTPGHQKFWPYGESYFNPPSGRFSNGRIIPDFIAEFAGLPLIPAYLDPNNNGFLYGASFASGGSGVLVESSTPGYAIDLKTQLQYFFDLEKQYRKTLGDVKAERLVSDAVYVFSSGINDYSTFLASSQSSLPDFVGMMIGNLTEFFKGIHEKGGRKFGILSLPPFGCAPANRALQPGNTCNEEINTIMSLHNQALTKKLQELALQLEGFKYANYDQYSTFSKRINNPSKYGFKVGDTACCSSDPKRGMFTCGQWRGGVPEFELCDNPDDYVFFDSAHPSEAADRQFAEKFWSGDLDVTSPYNLKALFEGTSHDDAFL